MMLTGSSRWMKRTIHYQLQEIKADRLPEDMRVHHFLALGIGL
jgi:hypothetical protein